ncbi:MAG: non-canonical purine NTP pyrophosphatase, RdgB/HAM1 family [Lentisphaerae bacterium RIFOXYB12_FULL_65_16]|nr:MAG: non-canonical purine NTP pyrophosphatase, RdgB/HAM1 family [Lentisphaerae bacterium RIFOXYA12_64_32]OGV94378.1 MAG: non-canonical purine NTP pyrophosphatase, RdgB/HAM1 family [Lentisphaerae bacterium RIFOXYB12_FULL_65_16]
MKRILAATGNRHKLEEMRQILKPCGVEVLGAGDPGVPALPDVTEDGATFEANAVKKAVEVAAATGFCTLADDSGLEVVALHGAPGVLSARYAGEPGNDRQNVIKLLHALQGIFDRRAQFTCVIALATPAGLIGTARGEVRGRIIFEPRGTSGFGYDPVFVPDGQHRTFAELPGAVKNSMSHRGRALEATVGSGLFDKLT